MFMGRRQIVMVHTPDIFHLEEFKDIVHAQRQLPIGMMRIDDIAAVREIHQQGTAGILSQQGIILIRQATPKASHRDPLAPLQFTQQGDAVEDLAIHIPVQIHTGKPVRGELHVVDGLEGIVLQEIGQICLRHDE